jgi:hypothetical protein
MRTAQAVAQQTLQRPREEAQRCAQPCTASSQKARQPNNCNICNGNNSNDDDDNYDQQAITQQAHTRENEYSR